MKGKKADEQFREGLRDELEKKVQGNPLALGLLKRLENDPEVQALISHGNTLVIGRLNYNDHGPTHSHIASINALTVLEILEKNGIVPNQVKEREGTLDDAQLVVLAGTYLHDIGNAVHREGHHSLGTILADPIIRRHLSEIYPEGKADRIRASILECIYSHDENVPCLSVEAGCVTVGDGTDMANGRARVPFSMGKIDIHSVSALAIDRVKISEGEKKPVKIHVTMTEAAGVFQVQEVLGKKIISSGLREYIEVTGRVADSGRELRIENIDF